VTTALWIVQLSDLHFGPHSRFAGQDPLRLARLHTQALGETRPALRVAAGEKVGLVIVTGDIAEAARPREYAEAHAFFAALMGELGLPRRCAVFVPGNHDVSWNATKKVTLEQDDDGFDNAERDHRIQAEKLRQFERFVQEFYGKDEQQIVQPLGHGAFVYSFPEQRVAVAALNSCERESHLAQGGYLSEAQAQALMVQWRTGEAHSWLKIIAIHHNPVATVPANVTHWVEYLKTKKDQLKEETLAHFVADTHGFEGRERLRAVAEDCQVQVVLHGHHHAASVDPWVWRRGGKGQTLVLSAGSWGLEQDQLPAGQPAMVHLLRLDPARAEARSLLRMYEPRARAEGEVEAGHFAVDAANPEGVTLHLCVPSGWHGVPERADVDDRRGGGALARDFVAAYRETLKRTYERWELGGLGAVQPGGAGRPVEARLDDMYLPLRLGKGFAPERTDAGQTIGPDELLAREARLVIRGPAGSGKTTWMKWTFRRLVELPGALPFLVELRKLAADWEKAQPRGTARTLEAYLEGWVAEAGLSGWAGAVREALASTTGPRPVLLVDGWDELGPLGHEVREKLQQLCSRYPRIVAVVSSRPYGDSRPTQSDGFEVLDIQPLSDEEIAAQAEQFQARVYGNDAAAARASAGRFLAALGASVEAKELARTALLLTMMLLISRDRPMPDRRHRLYEECLRNLLSARPQLREAEGAQRLREAWTPNDSEERLRAVARLAFEIQAEGYKRSNRSPIVRSWDELEPLLPDSWRREERRRFLVWLVASAGVMVDRADEKLMFTHLSFQEYLTAHQMEATLEGPEARIAACRERMDDVDWWETLRLWAAIVEGRNPEHLAPVLAALVEGEAEGFWLAGAMLADGVGEVAFERWCAGLRQRFHAGEARFMDVAARAWAGSRQEQRRQRIAAIWPEVERELRWLPAVQAAGWREDAGIPGASVQNAFARLLASRAERWGIAEGRVLAGCSPLWPGRPAEVLLLRLWSGHRSAAGLRLQTLLSQGGAVHLNSVAARWLKVTTEDPSQVRDWARELVRNLERNWARKLMQYWARDWARDWAQDLARDWARDLARDWVRDWARDLARDSARDWARGSARDSARDWARDLARYLARDWVRDWARDWALPENASWVIDFAALEIASFGRAGTRVHLAFADVQPDPLLHLFQTATRLSLHLTTDPTAFQQALVALPPATDPLWPALARHLTRRASLDDQALLEDLARHPEKRDPPLSWALQYYVRGDLILDDGREILLDNLCDELGLPRLPYLEDLPDELELDDLEAPEI
jgi:predicted phosphodiesterase